MTLEEKFLPRVVSYKGRWKLTVQHHRERHTFYSSLPGDAGRRDCAHKAACWVARGAPVLTSSRLYVKDVYEAYIKDRALRTKDIRNVNSRFINHVAPVIGRIPLDRLCLQDLQRVVDTAYSQGHLSHKTLVHLRGDLSGFCKFLYCSGLRNDLRTDIIRVAGQASHSSKRALTPEEMYILFSNSNTTLFGKVVKDDLIYAYRFDVLYGPRPGELMGLQWGDIRRDGIHIQRSINLKNEVTDGKNLYAKRILPWTETGRELLREQLQYRSPSRDPQQRVFGDYCPVTFHERWDRYCKFNHIGPITPYELRHTFASNNKYLHLWTLDILMGHVHPGVSLGIYAHEQDSDMDNVGAQLDANLRKQIELGKKALDEETEPEDIEAFLLAI